MLLCPNILCVCSEFRDAIDKPSDSWTRVILNSSWKIGKNIIIRLTVVNLSKLSIKLSTFNYTPFCPMGDSGKMKIFLQTQNLKQKFSSKEREKISSLKFWQSRKELPVMMYSVYMCSIFFFKTFYILQTYINFVIYIFFTVNFYFSFRVFWKWCRFWQNEYRHV